MQLPSASGIVPPRHVGKVWAIMLFRGEDDKYANAVAWGKVQGLLGAQMLDPGAYDVVVAESKRLIAGKQIRGYRPGYADMLAECGHSQV